LIAIPATAGRIDMQAIERLDTDDIHILESPDKPIYLESQGFFGPVLKQLTHHPLDVRP
jgi:hypothetical protein